MKENQSQQGAIAQVKSDVLSCIGQGNNKWTVGRLESALLECFPAQDAETWDRTGLIAGDPNQEITGVAIALDPTVKAVRSAKVCGANVLLTHHPVFIDPPCEFHPLGAGSFGPGSVIWEALSHGIALMNFHTTLDVSKEASRMLPGFLGLDFIEIVDCVTDDGRGYGQLSKVRDADAPMTLRNLAARCLSVFGRQPRVWGREDTRISSVVTCTGSAGGLVEECAFKGYDCIVCGEVRYHSALAAVESGLCLIELGHDVSELPLCAILASATASVGVPESAIAVLDQGSNWFTPEAIRR